MTLEVLLEEKGNIYGCFTDKFTIILFQNVHICAKRKNLDGNSEKQDRNT